MRRDRHPTCGMDPLHRLGERPEGRDPLLDEERQQVPAAGRDLLPDDHLEAEAPGRVERARAQRGGRPLPRRVHLQVEAFGELHVGRAVAERQDAKRLWYRLAQSACASATPTIESRVTMPARRSSLQRSVPAGRSGSTM